LLQKSEIEQPENLAKVDMYGEQIVLWAKPTIKYEFIPPSYFFTIRSSRNVSADGPEAKLSGEPARWPSSWRALVAGSAHQQPAERIVRDARL
jgi:hypothetical protein